MHRPSRRRWPSLRILEREDLLRRRRGRCRWPVHLHRPSRRRWPSLRVLERQDLLRRWRGRCRRPVHLQPSCMHQHMNINNFYFKSYNYVRVYHLIRPAPIQTTNACSFEERHPHRNRYGTPTGSNLTRCKNFSILSLFVKLVRS